MFKPTLLLLAGLLTSVSIQASQFMDRVETLIEEKNLPGMVVYVKHRGETLVHDSAGYKNVESQIPMTTDTVFKWYSMSKPVTAAAVLRAAQMQEIDLSESALQDYFPAFERHPNIPIHNLMTHTAGFDYGGSFGTWAGFKYWLLDPLEKSDSLDEMMNSLSRIGLIYEPGTQWKYSMSSDVQGALIESIAGMPYEEFMAREFFQPLGMHSAGFILKGDGQEANMAPIHFYTDKKTSELFASPDKMDKPLPSGGSGMYGTAADFMRFLELLQGEHSKAGFLNREALALLTTNQLPAKIDGIPAGIYPDSGYSYGSGVQIGTEHPHLSQGSYYWAGLAGSIYFVDPEQDITAVVMTAFWGQRRSVEKYLIPMIYEYIQEQNTAS